jgi:hypothetical protein
MEGLFVALFMITFSALFIVYFGQRMHQRRLERGWRNFIGKWISAAEMEKIIFKDKKN